MKKLYRVRFEYEAYALAESQDEDTDIIQEAIEGSYSENPPGPCRTEATEKFMVPTEWLDAVPYGSEDDRTIREIIKTIGG